MPEPGHTGVRDGLPEARGSGLRKAHGGDRRAGPGRLHGPRLPGAHAEERPHFLVVGSLGASPPRKASKEAGGELRLALLLTGPFAGRAAAGERIRALSGQVDYAVLVQLLERRRMLPLVGGRLASLAPDAVPAEFSRAIRTRLQRDRAGNMARQAQARAVAGALGARGIRALPIKGPGLAARVHGHIRQRAPGDIDVLVRREDLPAAVDVLRGEGYARPQDPVDREGLP